MLIRFMEVAACELFASLESELMGSFGFGQLFCTSERDYMVDGVLHVPEADVLLLLVFDFMYLCYTALARRYRIPLSLWLCPKHAWPETPLVSRFALILLPQNIPTVTKLILEGSGSTQSPIHPFVSILTVTKKNPNEIQ